ncbi:MAG: PepSY-associated TM helix domain-containing protein [Spongiibacteraceae bacterium]
MKVRTDILRVYTELHTWVGITSGLLLFIGFFAGALTMFKQPLDRWTSAPTQQIQQVTVDKIDRLVSQLVVARPDSQNEFLVSLESGEHIHAAVTWGGGSDGPVLDLSSSQWQASLDTEGQLQLQQAVPTQLGNLIDQLHRTAGIPAIIDGEYLGVYLLGVAAALYFLALVSGVIVLLPTLVKDFFAVRAGKNKKRFWLDIHNIIGITSLPYHIVISLTVVVFAFHDQFYDALGAVVYNDQPMFTRPAVVQQQYAPQDLLPVSTLVNHIEAAAPGFSVTELLYMGIDTDRPMVRGAITSAEHVVHGPLAGYIGIHPFTGKIISTSMVPGQGSVWGSIVSSFFALHFGSYGGNIIRWVYFLLGISGAFLFYSGNLLWIEKRRKRQKQQRHTVSQRLAARNLAAATIGVCLGAVAAVGFSLVMGKWAYAYVDTINWVYLYSYYTVFIGAVVWSFWRGPAIAGPQLLALCGIAAVLIPLTSLLAWLFPSLGLWVNGSLASLSVDAVALLSAWCFYRAAIFSRQRALHGPVDSVWSVHARVGSDSKLMSEAV